MKHKKYIMALGILMMGMVMSCRDESLYPLPYNDRTFGAYLRMYSIRSNVLDLADPANTGFETTFEVVDAEGGNLLQEIEFYASFRAGTGLTEEVFIKSVPGSFFTEVTEPTYSEYKRATIRITHAETDAALDGAPAQAPGFWPSLAAKINYPGSLVNGNQVVYRWKMILTTGQEFSVFNPQNTNSSENNSTANITGGQYYSSPFTFTMTARTLTAGSWVGNYSLTQAALWSPAHSYDFHANFPDYLKETLFPNQEVILSTVSGGLSTEREFTVNYRGENVTMRINMENGTVFIPLQNSTIDCSAERELYWTMPTAGNFTKSTLSTVALVAPLPTGTIANRGAYNPAIDGTTVGNTFTIAVDDDCDEYGRRNGYCTWTRRVSLRLTKL